MTTKTKSTKPTTTKKSTRNGIKNKASPKSKPLELMEGQTKMVDFFPIRRSGRTSGTELKKKEKDELDGLILNHEREFEENHLKVVEFEEKGRGIVVTRIFNRGEFVVEYAGDLIQKKAAKQREKEYRLSPSFGCYMYYFHFNNKHFCIDATQETGRLGRLVNHSRLKPNCCTKVVEVLGIPRLILVAMRQLLPGDEVLYDYGDRSKESLKTYPWLAS